MTLVASWLGTLAERLSPDIEAGESSAAVLLELPEPQPGPQELFDRTTADIAILGGGAGGGKTWALLREPIRHAHNPDFGAVIFRRTYPQITNEGGMWDESFELYRPAGAVPRENSLDWTFPGGARVKFAHMQHEKDKEAWKGSQIPLLCFDQLEDFTESQFFYMLSRNRSKSGIRPYVRASCNPIPADDETGGWLNRFIAWWIDQKTGLPIPERAGVLRWFLRVNEQLVWADNAAELEEQYPEHVRNPVTGELVPPKSVTFIPAMLSDNRILEQKDPGYRASLMALSLVERERLLGGNWNVRPTAGKVLNRAWFKTVAAAPAGARKVRYWDKAGTDDKKANTGLRAKSAGVLISESGGKYYLEDLTEGMWSALPREEVILQKARADGKSVDIYVEQEPGSGGKESAERTVTMLAGWAIHADRVTGSKIERARGFSAQAEAGNVYLVAGEWNESFLSQAHRFEEGAKGIDAVDAAVGGFNKLTGGPQITKAKFTAIKK